MLRGVVVSAALLSMLSGCAAPTAQLTNNKGQVAKCSSFGFGVLGTLFAVSTHRTCVDQDQKQGFHQMPATAPAASTSSSTSTGQATQK
ncbi:MAG: hypothetical protein WBF47_25565 [Xanthobacteraceae bacterium]